MWSVSVNRQRSQSSVCLLRKTMKDSAVKWEKAFCVNGLLGKMYILLKFKGYHYLGAVVCIFISKYIRWILRLQTVLTGFVTFHWRGFQEKPASPPQQLHSDIIILWPSLKNWISSSWNNTKPVNPMSMRTFWHYITQSFISEETMLISFENSDRIPSSKLITKKVNRGHENLNQIQRNLICLTTGSHSWNITYTPTHFFDHFFFILSHSAIKTAPFCSRLTCLTVVIIKKMFQCTPDTWFTGKLRHGVTMIHQTASVRAEGET